MHTDERYMQLAIRLAKRAQGLTSPNPAVGAVIVKSGRVIGKGYHKRCGLPHAEINAIKDAGRETRGSTLYVTLEPCDHFGRTGPCTDAIIQSGIAMVVAAMKDPNPLNNGRGISKLNRYGIKTSIGILEDESRSINLPYIKYITKRLPYVTVKIAESIDGKIATDSGQSRWITDEDSRRYVHVLRSKVDAVMVGVNTVIKDDPLLLSKAASAKRQPARIIVDSHLRTPIGAKIFSGIHISKVLIATAKKNPARKIKPYENKGAKVLFLRSKAGRVDLKSLLAELARMEMAHVLVEGGGELVGSLAKERLVDRFLFFIAPKIIGGKNAPGAVGGDGIERMDQAIILKKMKIKRFKRDVMIDAEVL